jgi:hypothetical protein
VHVLDLFDPLAIDMDVILDDPSKLPTIEASESNGPRPNTVR